ncbi:hypothetical protein DL96DRAFT_1810835 [Flagelloscypha sp. PMI_526]|nr:hypothetical protein DL96DRAFT_1810835 [Flagelloscypha sp. PMI_526]
MTSLPIDLLPNILSSLEASDLEKCCLVTQSFHGVARQLLFSHLILSSTTWKAKCRFLLDAPDDHLLKLTKSLTIYIVGMPVFFEVDEVPSLFVSLLQKFDGHRLAAFCMNALPNEYRWLDLSPHFERLIFDSILPFTSSLQFVGFTYIPLLRVIGRCSGLLDNALGANSDSIGNLVTQSEKTQVLPSVRSISFGTFGTSDFNANISLSQYLGLPETRIQSLSFAEYCSSDKFPISLSFLGPFRILTQHLLHLSFGTQLYDVIVAAGGQYKILPLGMFPQLQTLQFAFSTGSYDSRRTSGQIGPIGLLQYSPLKPATLNP